ncbi:MAG: dehydratase [Alcaligenaceae bacterium]|jgi:acyl dehydratase|uniref:MaoC family dehydratase n=1 Tax=Rhodococcus koreensis TaxID=99653 RepID=UPI00106446B4|nr:dehydratase [Rhodococcus sp. IEGM 248]QSE86717.1 MaoC family dehydratase N-terminal domain-containing protein [Rhodococcus koreensis]RYH51240.1 MAG: dehydratase [Alcaligenaceae bacterium]
MTDHFLVPIGRFGPVTRSMLSEYAQASGDNNPLHLSDAAAQLAGHREVIAQGMLSMAFVGRWVTSWCPLDQIHSLSSRFTAPTPLGSHLICEGHVTCKEQESAKIVYTVTTEMNNVVTIRGTVVVSSSALERRSGPTGLDS